VTVVRESAFRFPVADLLAHVGDRRPISFEAEIDWGLELSRVGPTLFADLVLESASGGLVVRGRVSTGVANVCHRCLREWQETLVVEVLEALGVDDDPDGYRLHGDVADLEPVLRDAVLLAVPLSPTCRPDCRGLCAVCGADLNGTSCPGHDDEPDSPFAPLRGLLDT
jgi:uncharacterized protein